MWPTPIRASFILAQARVLIGIRDTFRAVAQSGFDSPVQSRVTVFPLQLLTFDPVVRAQAVVDPHVAFVTTKTKLEQPGGIRNRSNG